MLTNIFSGITEETITSISMAQLIGAFGASLLLGLVIAVTYMFRTRYTKSFVITLTLLPAIVCMVILMVNGNIGAGVAVAGTFSLVRFRSVPGTAREILMIFLAMATGLITGMGYIGIAAIFTIIMCAVFMACSMVDLGAKKNADRYKTLRVVIPEDLDYTGVFDDLFGEYTTSTELTQVKTTNMGSMYKLTYDVTLRDPAREKELIDHIRCRNGNLEVSVSRQGTMPVEL